MSSLYRADSISMCMTPNVIISGFKHVIGGPIKRSAVIAMVGLPARGKTYMSTKVARYLNWIGIRTQMFNVGNYRRKLGGAGSSTDHNFFRDDNIEARKIRDAAVLEALDDVARFLLDLDGDVAVLDATNTTRDRRQLIVFFCEKNDFDCMFIESICDDPQIIETNIREVKVFSPDYRGCDNEESVLSDFNRRIEHYKAVYETIDEKEEEALSFLKIINVGAKYIANRVQGQIKSRLVYFLMNCSLVPHTIYLTRNGESEYNVFNRVGGDSFLSDNGKAYARELTKYMEAQNIPDLCVWTSVLKRTQHTAKYFKKASVECWKALNELDAGICDGLSYEEIEERFPVEYARRGEDKYHYRYPQGESYQDLVARLEPCIMELERRHNILVICHQAVARCLLAYFINKSSDELPYLEIPLHTVFKLTMRGYGCDVEQIRIGPPAVDTHRQKPINLRKSRSKDEGVANHQQGEHAQNNQQQQQHETPTPTTTAITTTPS